MDNISKIQKQTFRYYYEDGLVEIAVGILFAIIGLDVWLISSAPQGSPLSITAWILLPILTVAGIYSVQRFVKNLKEKYVHPRLATSSTPPNPTATAGWSLALPWPWRFRLPSFLLIGCKRVRSQQV